MKPLRPRSSSREKEPAKKHSESGGAGERLQKILASAGIASRRKAEELIVAGRVQVNGQVVTELGSKADPERDHIRVDGKLIHAVHEYRYYMLNKPRGYITTASDPQGRPTAMDFFARVRSRMFPVGRLDYASEGLLVVTNDGALANSLSRASAHVPKTYLVKVGGIPSEDGLNKLRRGVSIPLGELGARERRVRTAPAKIKLFRGGDNPWYEITITEGRNRQLRKMFEEIGRHVEKIRRVGYGPLVLNVEPGEFRELTARELRELREVVAAPGSRIASSVRIRQDSGPHPKTKANVRPPRRIQQ